MNLEIFAPQILLLYIFTLYYSILQISFEPNTKIVYYNFDVKSNVNEIF